MALPSTNSFYQACFLEQLFTFAEKQKANLALIHLRKGTRADTQGLGALLHLFTFGRKFNGRKFNGQGVRYICNAEELLYCMAMRSATGEE